MDFLRQKCLWKNNGHLNEILLLFNYSLNIIYNIMVTGIGLERISADLSI